MTSRNLRLKVSLLLMLLAVVASIPAFAGSAVIGSVAGSKDATIGGQRILPNTAVFSGDSLKVGDGVAVVAVGNTSRMVFGRGTSASFLRDSKEITVLLTNGNVSMYHPDDGVALRVKAGDVSIAPATGFKTLGEIAMVGGAITITAKEGSLQVEGRGSAIEVAKGKTVSIPVRTARAPKPGPAMGGGGGGSALGVATLGAAGISAVLAGVAISRAGDAKTNAAAAITAANTASSNAVAATSAANTANANAVAVGCALNVVDNSDHSSTFVSPFTPTGGATAPGC